MPNASIPGILFTLLNHQRFLSPKSETTCLELNARSINEFTQSTFGHYHSLPLAHPGLLSFFPHQYGQIPQGLTQLIYQIQNLACLNLVLNVLKKLSLNRWLLVLSSTSPSRLCSFTPSLQLDEWESSVVFITFCRDKIILHHHLHFLPKVSLEYHINQKICLPMFYPKPHDSRRETSLHTGLSPLTLTGLSPSGPLPDYLYHLQRG